MKRDTLEHQFFAQDANHPPVEWQVARGLTDYETALAFMQERAEKIYCGQATELIWLVEHPPLYTAGTSAKIQDLLKPDFLPVFTSGRGGEYTYHGPGQRVVYVMLNLKARRSDVRAFVAALEEWIIRSLAMFDIWAERREDRVGVWVARSKAIGEKCENALYQNKEDKIAAIGIRLKKWVSFHGLAINVAPDLSHYDGIVPCGICTISPIFSGIALERLSCKCEAVFG